MAGFIPRAAFPSLDSLTRSYFLGHHRAGLNKMKTMISQIDLLIECRDYRLPLSSRNPLFEEVLSGKDRVIVYMKKDLGSTGTKADRQREETVKTWHLPTKVLFCDGKNFNTTASGRRDVFSVLQIAKEYASARDSLTASRMMIVGMPNVGKSTLLNALRVVGVGKGKAAKTGAFAGVTRKVMQSVKVIDGDDPSECMYLVDTPGVFVPYVSESETMLKLSLVGSVKYGLVPIVAVADYLLYHLNLNDPAVYAEYHQPTNDIMVLLEAIATKTGRLDKGGGANIQGAADYLISRWRQGRYGCFLLDEVTDDALEKVKRANQERLPSLNQALKAEKEARKLKARAKGSSTM